MTNVAVGKQWAAIVSVGSPFKISIPQLHLHEISLDEYFALYRSPYFDIQNRMLFTLSIVEDLQRLQRTTEDLSRWTSKDRAQSVVNQLVVGTQHIGGAVVWKEHWWSKWSIIRWEQKPCNQI